MSKAGSVYGISMFLAFLALNSGAHAQGDARPGSSSQIIVPEAVFAPPGFDTTDIPQIVISGVLPSTCYQLSAPLKKVEKSARRIVIRAQAEINPALKCRKTLLPFTQVIDLEKLPAGRYRVIVEGDSTESKGPTTVLPIKAAARPNQVDDYLYALVDDVQIEPMPSGGISALTVRGYLTSSCMSLVQVKDTYRNKQVIEISPIAELAEGRPCVESLRPFETRVSVGISTQNKILVHARSMGGGSLNKVFDPKHFAPQK